MNFNLKFKAKVRRKFSLCAGRVRNIYFPFDIGSDTALSVAAEMVDQLDITEQDVTKIAEMIDGEIASLVPEWKKGLATEENAHCSSASFCHNCVSNGSLLDYVSPDCPNAKNLQVLQCSKHGSAHGRFEEITYQVEDSEECAPEAATKPSTQPDGIHYADIWAQRDGLESNSQESRDIYCDEAHKSLDTSNIGKDEKIITMDNQSECNARNSSASAPLDDYENDIRQELRWLKAKYQMQLRELKDQQLKVKRKPSSLTPNTDSSESWEGNAASMSVISSCPHKESKRPPLKSSNLCRHFASHFPVDAESKCSNVENQKANGFEAMNGSYSPEQLFTAKSFYAGALLPQPLHRATSLPVDAIDV